MQKRETDFFNELLDEMKFRDPMEDHYDLLIYTFLAEPKAPKLEELIELHELCAKRAHLRRPDGQSYAILYFMTKNQISLRGKLG